MQLFPWQSDIHSRLVDNLPNNDIYLEGMPEGTEATRMSNGMIRPYASIWFGQSTDAGPGNNNITGVRHSSRLALFRMEIVGPSGTSLLQFEDAIRDLLVGYKPDDQGELQEDGAPTIRDPAELGSGLDVRYRKFLAFSGIVNVDAVPAI